MFKIKYYYSLHRLNEQFQENINIYKQLSTKPDKKEQYHVKTDNLKTSLMITSK